MPICRKCDALFPNSTKINGVVKIINSRKYCLKCSPFGLKNRRKLELPIVSRRKRQVLYVKRRRLNLKLKAVQYLGGKCSRCGYSKCVTALEFHHRNPSKKRFPISGFVHRYKWSLVKRELDKCDLVCANCHREIEMGI